MAVEIRQYTLTIPPGTPVATPTVQPMTFPPRTVEWLQIVVPPGSSGLVGWQVQVSGITVIPYDSDEWIITSGEYITWQIDNAPDTGDWYVAGYNLGTLPHSIYFRFGLGLVTAPTPAGSNSIDESVLNSASASPNINTQ